MSTAERQARTLLRAWPIPDRVERGEEIVGTTLDLLPDNETRLPLGLAANLVMGGLRARWRMRPPPWRWLLYRMECRLSPRWQRWMLNDLSTPGWRRRILTSQAAISVAVLAVVWLMMPLFLPATPNVGMPFPWVMISYPIGMLTFFPRFRTDRFRKQQLTGSDSNLYGSSTPVPWPPPTAAGSSDAQDRELSHPR